MRGHRGNDPPNVQFGRSESRGQAGVPVLLMPQLFRDFVRHEARPFDVLGFKRYCRDARMSAAAVLFRKARQIVSG